jgi:hypothetical protein
MPSLSAILEARHAGRTLTARYERIQRSWRRRMLRRIRALLLGGVIILAFSIPWAPTSWHFFIGLFAGAFLCLWLSMREEAPHYAYPWYVGALGERRTAWQLLSLGKAWTVRHDLAARRSNIDHVVAGPGGIFLLETKNLLGKVSLENGHLQVARLDDFGDSYVCTDPGRHVKSRAHWLHEELERMAGLSKWVQSVVVIWGAFEEQLREEDDVFYVHGDHLTEWLSTRPARLSDQELNELQAAVSRMPRAVPFPKASSH